MPVWGEPLSSLRDNEPFECLPLSRGYFALVSLSDYAWARENMWNAKVEDHTVYARRTMPKDAGRTTSYLHREVVGRLGFVVPHGFVVDHINREGLDCRRSNLRIVDVHANNLNLTGWGAVPYRGVVASGRKYRARIKDYRTGERIELGYFSDPQEAARAYDRYAIGLFGQFATLNHAPEDYPEIAELLKCTVVHEDIPF